MAGRSRSPPLAFIAPPTLTSFAPGSFTLQQVPSFKRGDGPGRSDEPPFTVPFSSSTGTVTQALASLHEKYHTLLSHERQAKDLERSIWEAERLLFVQRITTLEDTVKDLQGQLGKPQSVADVPGELDKSQSQYGDVATSKDLPSELADVQPKVVTAPRIDAETTGGNIVEQIVEVPFVAHEDSPVEESRDGPPRADSPGLPEYPYPKTPKSVKGDVEPDESEIVNLLDQAGRILGKSSYKFQTYDDEYDDPEEDFKLILKPNRNFRSNWAF